MPLLEAINLESRTLQKALSFSVGAAPAADAPPNRQNCVLEGADPTLTANMLEYDDSSIPAYHSPCPIEGTKWIVDRAEDERENDRVSAFWFKLIQRSVVGNTKIDCRSRTFCPHQRPCQHIGIRLEREHVSV